MALLENVIGRGPAASIPAAGVAGAIYCETDTGRVRRDNGITWDIIAGTQTGTPLLHGPYVVNYTDIPTEGSTLDLWTPAVGDVLLRLFPDLGAVTLWDSGHLFIGQNVDGTVVPMVNCFAYAHNAGDLGMGALTMGDNVLSVVQLNSGDAAGVPLLGTAQVFNSTDPVQIQLAQTGGTPPGSGHIELYALIATAIAP